MHDIYHNFSLSTCAWQQLKLFVIRGVSGGGGKGEGFRDLGPRSLKGCQKSRKKKGKGKKREGKGKKERKKIKKSREGEWVKRGA